MRTSTKIRPWLQAKIDAIKGVVGRHHGITSEEINSDSRKVPLPEVRHTAMALSRKLLGASFPEITIAFNKTNHMSAVYACDKTEERKLLDPGFNRRFYALETKAREALSL